MRRGVTWTYASMVTSAFIQVAVTAATARMLAPEAFGLMAMANVVLRFGGYFAQMGVGRALVQRPTIDELDVRAAFTSSTALGWVVGALVVAGAPLATAFYQDDSVASVVRWLALTFVFSGVGATAGALLQRQLRFKATGAIEVASYVVGYAVPTLTLAAAGAGIWSLVAGTIGQVVVGGGLAYALTRHSLVPTFDLRVHRRLLAYGATVSGISFLEFIGSALDVLVIGRFGTPAQVGLYNRAFMLATLPSYRLAAGISRVLFPVLSAGQGDAAAFRHAFLTVTRTSVRIMVPVGVGMALAAPELVGVVLGASWRDAGPLVAVLAPALALSVLTMVSGTALDALGVLRGKAIVQAFYVVSLAGAMLVSATFGFELRTITVILGVSLVIRVTAYFLLTAVAGVIESRHLVAIAGWVFSSALVTALLTQLALTLTRSSGAGDLATLLAAMAAGSAALAVLFGVEIRAFYRRSWRRERD